MPQIQLCHLDELDTVATRGFELMHESTSYNIFVVRNGDQVTAYQNSCPHNLAPLNWSADIFLSHDQQYIQCANHGALFEIDSGHCIYGPCAGQSLIRVNITIRNQLIFAEL